MQITLQGSLRWAINRSPDSFKWKSLRLVYSHAPKKIWMLYSSGAWPTPCFTVARISEWCKLQNVFSTTRFNVLYTILYIDLNLHKQIPRSDSFQIRFRSCQSDFHIYIGLVKLLDRWPGSCFIMIISLLVIIYSSTLISINFRHFNFPRCP